MRKERTFVHLLELEIFRTPKTSLRQLVVHGAIH